MNNNMREPRNKKKCYIVFHKINIKKSKTLLSHVPLCAKKTFWSHYEFIRSQKSLIHWLGPQKGVKCKYI